MNRRACAAVAALCGVALAVPAGAQAAGTGLDAYVVTIKDARTLQDLATAGFDMTEGRQGNKVEIVASRDQAAGLRKTGLTVTLRRDAHGRSALKAAEALQADDGSWDVYRPYFDSQCADPGAGPCYVGRDANGDPRPTLYQELSALAAANRKIVKSVVIGHTIRGVPILALKVTKQAVDTPDGTRPAVLYSSNQHAREWITAESNRRLLHLFVDNYSTPGDTSLALGTDGEPLGGQAEGLTKGELTKLVDTRELWFVVVANPDGYDFTFTPGNRLWRKNLRDNNGDGQITDVDGVDPNRNFPTKWNFDNEGSSSELSSETYRGTGPASEPETRAMDALMKRVDFEFQVNYHSAAELLLYPIGWQQTTYTADDPIYRAMSGIDEDSAIAGDPGSGAPDAYDPDVSAELYITNGETTDHAHTVYGTLAWTPEMDVADPDRGGGSSVFEFQDSESDLQDVLEKNIPFALDVAKSAADPANPVTHLGNAVPNFEVNSFAVSYGDPQTVQVDAKRSLGAVTVHWQVNGGDEKSGNTKEWAGGERYGGPGDVYFHRMRGNVTGTRVGDTVKVWFEAGGQRSRSFSYRVEQDTHASVLVMSAEDYSGKPGTGNTENPAYGDRTKPNFLSFYENALRANRVPFDVYDVDAHGRTAPDALGVLSHYKAVIWYTGNDTFIREPEAPGGTGTSKLALDEIVNVRDFLNEGGKLLYTGQNAAFGQLTGFNYNPGGQPPYCDVAETGAPNTIDNARCALLNDDFLQYWLGSYVHINAANDKDEASALSMRFTGGPFGNTSFALNGGDSADNQVHTYSMVSTSSILPANVYPQFKSQPVATFNRQPAFEPFGSHYMYAASKDEAWQRLSKTIDLTGNTSGNLAFKISYDTENTFDYVVVEAHTVGQDDWTTLEESNGGTEADVGQSCDINWDTLHPFLTHYQTNVDKSQDAADADCTPDGTEGTPPGHWFGATGNSAGWQDWSFDLSAYAGKQVEVSISYIQDFASDGLGVFVDNVSVSKDGAVAETADFESGNGGWTPSAGPNPELEPVANWRNSPSVGFQEGPAMTTADTVYYGFGIEGVKDAGTRATLVGNALRYLGVLGPRGPLGGGGGTQVGLSQPVAPAPRPKARAKIMGSRKLRLDSKGRVAVRVSCAGDKGGTCAGTVKLLRSSGAAATRTMGSKKFRLASGKTATIRVKMNARSRRALARKGSQRVVLSISGTDSSGARISVHRTIRVMAAKKR